MLTKQEIIAEAKRLKFADIGFTDAQPFDSQKEYLIWLGRSSWFRFACGNGS